MKLSTWIFTLGLVLAAPATRALAQDASPTDKLIADLGADDVNKRDEAQKKLEALGRKALPALEKAEKESKDAEIRARAHEAIIAIKKSRGESPDGKDEKDEERQGPPLPPERRFGRVRPLQPQQGADPDLDELFKMFEGQGQNGEMKALGKILEQLQKQMRGMDEEFQKELKRPRGPNNNNGNMRVFQFGVRPRTAVENRLGATLDPTPPALQAQLDLGATEGGLLVNELNPNGPAWKAGLKLYDVILKVDGNAVRSPADLRGLGEKDAKIEILRKAKKETLVVRAQSDEAPEAKPAEPPAEKKSEEKQDEKEPGIRKF